MAEGVKFIRVHGRVVPVNAKTKYKAAYGTHRRNKRIAQKHGVDYSKRLDTKHPIGKAVHEALYAKGPSFKAASALSKNKKVQEAKSAYSWQKLFTSIMPRSKK